MQRQLAILCAAALSLAAIVAFAKVPPEQAEKLDGPELTPLGAERAGNLEGTIPAWIGGIEEAIPNYKPGDFHPDPYPDDPILFTITADHLHQYADKLSEGQQALLKTYPQTWRMHVYPTRRSAAYLPFVYEGSKANAIRAEVDLKDLGGVLNAEISSPFPLPQQGVEVIWNHLLRWRGIYVRRINGQAAVTRQRGRFRVILLREEVGFPYDFPGPHDFKKKYPFVSIAFRQKIVSPGLLTGWGQLALESLNYNRFQRNTWVYNPDLRRVFRTPFTGYDHPAPNSEGLRLNDELDMFNGSPALFDWKLLGKREMFIPYNAYRLHSGKLKYSDILQRGHINPDLARYELHRVWVVEGTVKSPTRRRGIGELSGHIYSRRMFYVDEDSWQLAIADNYDSDGQLWRVSEGHMINYYEIPVPWYTLEAYHDLQARRYLVTGLDNQRQPPQFLEEVNPRRFSPNALDYYIR